MSGYRLYATDDGVTHLDRWHPERLPFESGPGPFKGVGGMVLGDASRVMLMRLEPGAEPPLHRAALGLAMLLTGSSLVLVSDGAVAQLRPGDAVWIESTGTEAGGWSPRNTGDDVALLALVQMPPLRRVPDGH